MNVWAIFFFMSDLMGVLFLAFDLNMLFLFLILMGFLLICYC